MADLLIKYNIILFDFLRSGKGEGGEKRHPE